MNGPKFVQIWPKVREVVAFFGGMTIMFYETIFDKSDRPWLYAAAIGMMGLPVARYIENTLGRYTGDGPEQAPPQPPQQQTSSTRPEAQQQIPSSLEGESTDYE